MLLLHVCIRSTQQQIATVDWISKLLWAFNSIHIVYSAFEICAGCRAEPAVGQGNITVAPHASLTRCRLSTLNPPPRIIRT